MNSLIKNDDLINQIINEENPEKLKELTAVFQQAQLKNNIIRANKLTTVVSMLDDEIQQRLQLEPETISNKDMVAYLNATQNAMNSVNQSINNIPAAVVQINNINTAANPFDGLSTSSRQNVLDAITSILNNNSGDNTIDIYNDSEDAF